MDDSQIPDAVHLPHLHDTWTAQWHVQSIPVDEAPASLTDLIRAQHRANFDLWHQEDEARDPQAPDARISAVKHAIDALNQRRNDLVETIDGSLVSALPTNQQCALHSETPGMMIDRMSILALKIFHTREETVRESASAMHREKNTVRLRILEEQRQDLAACLDTLLAELRAGLRRFKIYRQMKMYNDPDLNPILYNPGRQRRDSNEGKG